MADVESPYIEEEAATHENQNNDPVRSEETLPEPIAPATPQRFTSLLNELGELTSKLDHVHRVIFDVGNYFFAFQGVCLAAISNSSFFDCGNVWFLSVLCVLAAIPCLLTLTFVALKWLWLMNQVDAVVREMVNIRDKLKKEYDYTREVDAAKNCFSILAGRRYSRVIRRLLLAVGAVIHLTFAAIVATGPYFIICGHIHPWGKGGTGAGVYPI